jgi:hypothetical protein
MPNRTLRVLLVSVLMLDTSPCFLCALVPRRGLSLSARCLFLICIDAPAGTRARRSTCIPPSKGTCQRGSAGAMELSGFQVPTPRRHGERTIFVCEPQCSVRRRFPTSLRRGFRGICRNQNPLGSSNRHGVAWICPGFPVLKLACPIWHEK